MSGTLKVDPIIQEWIPPLDADSYSKLEASILDEGCRDALIVWGQTLVDGHHRYAICQAHKKPYRISRIEFTDIDHAEVWVRTNQAARRNLTDDQRAANADLLAEAEERISKRQRGKQGGRGRKKTQRPQGPPSLRSRKRAAAVNRVTEKRIRRIRAIRKADAALAKQIQAGTLSIRDAERILRGRTRSARRTEAAAVAKAAVIDDVCDVLHGDFRQLSDALDDHSIDLVFTDPPYHDKTIKLYADLGCLAARALKDGGSLITYISHHRQPEITDILKAAGLTFFWPLAIVHAGGPWPRMTEYGIVVHWKPLLWFVKGKFRDRADMRFIDDLVESPRREKDAHPWQQSIHAARYYIEGLTQPGDLVVDPFCGGGTTAVAAAQASRRWWTCDVDEQSVFIARKRVRDALERIA